MSVIVLLYMLARRIYHARLSSVFKYTSILVAMLAAGILYHTTNELAEMLDDIGGFLGLLLQTSIQSRHFRDISLW